MSEPAPLGAAALEADYRANVADGADGIYTDGLHDAWRLTERRAKRDDLIKPESGSSEPPMSDTDLEAFPGVAQPDAAPALAAADREENTDG